MARLIDADAAKIRFANYREDCINEDDINAANVFADVVSELDEFPTIDPVTAAAEALGMSPDRLRELAQAEKEGRLVVLQNVKYTDSDGEKALRHAMYMCGVQNNPVTRYTADAIAEKLTREAAEAALDDLEADHDTGRTTIGNSRLLG